MSNFWGAYQGYPRGLFFCNISPINCPVNARPQTMTKAATHAKYASCGSFLFFGLRRVWLSFLRAVTVGCRKRFLCPEAVYRYREWAKKRLKEQKQTMIKAATHAEARVAVFFLLFGLRRVWLSFLRAVTVGCRKRFLAPKPYADTASGQKTLKRAKVNMAKDANYDKSRNPR